MNQEVEKPKEKVETHVSEEKKQLVRDLAELMNKKTVMLVSIKSLPDALFQSIKKKLRGKAVIKVAKKSLVNFALEHAKNEHLKELEKHVREDSAILFSDDDAFEISGFLSDNKVPAKAKIGQEAPEDIEIKAGPTSLLPGPDISALSGVGLTPKVEAGKIHILKDKILVRKGEAISEEKASVLQKLDITPFEVGLEPLVAFSEGKVYVDIKIDREATLAELVDAYSRGLAFAVELGYPSGETIGYLIGKAGGHESALNGLVKTKVSDTPKEEAEKDGDNKSAEDVAEDSADNSEGAESSPVGSGEEKVEEKAEEKKPAEEGSESAKGEVKEVPKAHELAKKVGEETQEDKTEGEGK